MTRRNIVIGLNFLKISKCETKGLIILCQIQIFCTICVTDKNRKGAQLLEEIFLGGKGMATVAPWKIQAACTSIARAASSRKFTTCSRTPIEFYNGGSISNSLIGYISLDGNAHERAPPLILDRICRRPNS